MRQPLVLQTFLFVSFVFLDRETLSQHYECKLVSNNTAPMCYSTWSDYTSCPAANATCDVQGNIIQKELSNLGCQVFPEFFLYQYSNKMEQMRQTLPAYRKSMNLTATRLRFRYASSSQPTSLQATPPPVPAPVATNTSGNMPKPPTASSAMPNMSLSSLPLPTNMSGMPMPMMPMGNMSVAPMPMPGNMSAIPMAMMNGSAAPRPPMNMSMAPVMPAPASNASAGPLPVVQNNLPSPSLSSMSLRSESKNAYLESAAAKPYAVGNSRRPKRQAANTNMTNIIMTMNNNNSSSNSNVTKVPMPMPMPAENTTAAPPTRIPSPVIAAAPPPPPASNNTPNNAVDLASARASTIASVTAMFDQLQTAMNLQNGGGNFDTSGTAANFATQLARMRDLMASVLSSVSGKTVTITSPVCNCGGMGGGGDGAPPNPGPGPMPTTNMGMTLQQLPPSSSDVMSTDVTPDGKVSVACGFCSRKIRCCRDKFISWLDQKMDSDVCTNQNYACEVPPLPDRTCRYDLYMPQPDYTLPPDAQEGVLQKMLTKVQDKWTEILGTSTPSLNCRMAGPLCYCCCGSHTPDIDEKGYMVCRPKVPSDDQFLKPPTPPQPPIAQSQGGNSTMVPPGPGPQPNGTMPNGPIVTPTARAPPLNGTVSPPSNQTMPANPMSVGNMTSPITPPMAASNGNTTTSKPPSPPAPATNATMPSSNSTVAPSTTPATQYSGPSNSCQANYNSNANGVTTCTVDCTYSVFWFVAGGNITVNLTAMMGVGRWIALGFNTGLQMAGGDAIVATVNATGAVGLMEMNLPQTMMPQKLADLTPLRSSYSNGALSIAFTRPLSPYAAGVIDLNQCIYFLYPFSGGSFANNMVTMHDQLPDLSRTVSCLNSCGSTATGVVKPPTTMNQPPSSSNSTAGPVNPAAPIPSGAMNSTVVNFNASSPTPAPKPANTSSPMAPSSSNNTTAAPATPTTQSVPSPNLCQGNYNSNAYGVTTCTVNCTYSVFWSVAGGNITVNLTAVMGVGRWIALGFNTLSQMAGGDAIVATVNGSGSVGLTETNLPQSLLPQKLTDLTPLKSTYSNGALSITFTRPLSPYAAGVIDLNQCIYFLYPFSGGSFANNMITMHEQLPDLSRTASCLNSCGSSAIPGVKPPTTMSQPPSSNSTTGPVNPAPGPALNASLSTPVPTGNASSFLAPAPKPANASSPMMPSGLENSSTSSRPMQPMNSSAPIINPSVPATAPANSTNPNPPTFSANGTGASGAPANNATQTSIANATRPGSPPFVQLISPADPNQSNNGPSSPKNPTTGCLSGQYNSSASGLPCTVDCIYNVNWKIIGSNITMNITAVTGLGRWVGIGFNELPQMIGGEGIIATIDSMGNIALMEVSLPASMNPKLLATLTPLSASYKNGNLFISFTRPLASIGNNTMNLTKCVYFLYPYTGGPYPGPYGYLIDAHDRMPDVPRYPVCLSACPDIASVPAVMATGPGGPPPGTNPSSNCMSDNYLDPSHAYNIAWYVKGSNIYFTLTAQISSGMWTGIGFNSQPTITGADVIAIEIDSSGVITVEELNPAPDSFADTPTVSNSMYYDGFLAISFSRPLQAHGSTMLGLDQCGIYFLYPVSGGQYNDVMSLSVKNVVATNTTYCLQQC